MMTVKVGYEVETQRASAVQVDMARGWRRLRAAIGVAIATCAMWNGSSARAHSILPFTEEAQARGLTFVVKPYETINMLFMGYGCAIADLNSNGHQRRRRYRRG